MAFPSAATGYTLDDALREARNRASTIKAMSQTMKAQLAGGTAPASGILQYFDELIADSKALTTIASTPGMDAYAQAQLGATISANFSAMMTAVSNVTAWIGANYPKDPSGYLLSETIAGDGTRVQRTFASATTTQLQVLVDALIAAIA